MTPPDLIIHSQLIRTMVPGRVNELTPSEAGGIAAGSGNNAAVGDMTSVAITGGTITAIGNTAEIEALATSATEVVRVDGTMVPGFTDAHAHPLMSLSMARGADLSRARSLEEVANVLRAEAERVDAVEPGGWVLGWGLDPNVFPDGSITNGFMKAALGTERRAYVALFDAHSAIASTAALGAAGLVEGQVWDSGAAIVTGTDGALTGHLLEFEAMSEVQKCLPVQSLAERVEALRALLGAMAAEGITEVHVMDFNDADAVDLLTAAEALEPLPVRLRISPWCTPWMSDDEFAALQESATPVHAEHGSRWRVEGVKFFIDGTVEGGTAWLETPDTKGENTESAWGSIEGYAARVRALNAAGVPTATHAIGERGIREVAETLAALPDTGTQHRIEHIESVNKDVIDFIGSAGVAASMQPTHCTHYTRADGSDEWSIRLGEIRAARAWCIRDVIDSGAVLALGSDFPVAPYPVLPIMADAQLRRPVDDPSVEPVLPAQAITASEALAGYTTGPQSAIGNDGGYLAVGQPATLTILNVDPIAASAESLGAGEVLLTVSEGIVTYRA
jgi:predicted amidohydrolase YtcJ